uniref:DUF1847 domain-containing protein n=1 Tax=Candidatus Electronema sp. TaxID=2698783 RepID=UPI0040561567
MQKNGQFRKSAAEPEKVFAAAISYVRMACFGSGATEDAADGSNLTKRKRTLRNGEQAAGLHVLNYSGKEPAMNCANCKMQPKNRCSKEGFDCTGGKVDALECQLDENVPWQNISEELRSLHGDTLCRLEEIIEFSKKAGFKKLGLAFCVGLADEAAVVAEILKQVFTVESVCCKVGGMDKDKYGMSKIKPDTFEVACNPVAQAKILNRAETDLNIQLGLCVGHDLLFQKYAKAPITVLAVKDRALANNPLGAVYSSYWRKKLQAKYR